MITCYPAHAVTEDTWDKVKALREGRDAYASPFLDPNFARVVAEQRSDVVLITKRDWNGDLVAGWPVHKRPGRWARPVGGPFSNWHGPLVRVGSRVDTARLLGDAGFNGMSGHGFIGETISGENSLTFERTNVVDISEGWEDYHAKQSRRNGRFFNALQQSGAKLQKEHGQVSFRKSDRRPEALEWLIALKRSQYAAAGLHDVLAANWSQGLLRTLHTHRSQSLRGQLSTLSVGGTLVAAEFNLLSPHVTHAWITAIDWQYADYAPGSILFESLLKSMAKTKSGPKLYEAGPSDELHKVHFANGHWSQGRGAIHSTRERITPGAVARRTWSMMERKLPGKTGELLARARRRSDQILASELTMDQQIRGLLRAMSAVNAA